MNFGEISLVKSFINRDNSIKLNYSKPGSNKTLKIHVYKNLKETFFGLQNQFY